MDHFIELQEQASLRVLLTPAEAEELRNKVKMEVISGGDSVPAEADEKRVDPSISLGARSGYRVYSVNPGCQVGHFRLESDLRRTVRIAPKVGISNVFSLLGAAYSYYSDPRDSPFRSESVDYGVDKTQILEPLVRHFNKAVKGLLQDGLLASYLEREQTVKVLRGRLAFSKHLAQNLVRQDRLYCRFFQAEVDIPENQVILWTLTLLNRTGEWSQDVRQTLQSHVLHFGGVSVRQFLPRQFPIFHYDRLSSRYREVHSWCRLFINLLSISDRPGKRAFNGYLLNMNLLFERFVVSLFERANEAVPLVSVQPQKRHHLTVDGRIGVQPDLTLIGPNESSVVVDAKYKRTAGSEAAKHPDLYQVISYSVALGLIGQETTPVQGILVYPLAERSEELENILRIVTSKRLLSQMAICAVWLDLDGEDPVAEAERKFVKVLREMSANH
jgi:5-methylcytosine-specific restriction enzyme subunit McrC